MEQQIFAYLLVSKYLYFRMTDTKDKIVALADQLIRTRGFNAFSYRDIAAPMEIKNAAVHYYFPTKTDLGISVVAYEMERFAANREKWAALPENEQLLLLFDSFRKKSRQGFICLMGSLSPDFDTLPAPMQQKVQEMCGEILQWTAGCLESGRNKKLFRFQGDAYDRALLVVSNLLSSLLLSRVLGPKVFTRMSNQLLKDLH